MKFDTGFEYDEWEERQEARKLLDNFFGKDAPFNLNSAGGSFLFTPSTFSREISTTSSIVTISDNLNIKEEER